MKVATVSSKGQITIPQELRDRRSIVPGTRIEFVDRADGSVEMIPLTNSVTALAGFFPWDGPPVTIEEMNDAIGHAAAVRFMRASA